MRKIDMVLHQVTGLHTEVRELGGFNRLSQHLDLEVFDGKTAASSRSGAAAEDAFPWPVGFSAAG